MSLENLSLLVGSKCIFFIIISLYISGAVVSLILFKKQKISSFISNSTVITASLLGVFFSLQNILNTSKKTLEILLESNIDNISISFRVDKMSAFFILIISLLAFVVSIYSFGYLQHYFGKRNVGYFGFLYNTFILSMIMVVTSGHLFFFLIAWEIMSLVSYFLVVYEHEKLETQKAGKMYIIMTHIGTAFIIAAFVLIYKYTGTAYFSSIHLQDIPTTAKNIIFIFCLVGFGTKAGLIPLHVWLPLAHPAAPSNISAIMSGIMIKTAIYGIIRVAMYFFSVQHLWWGTILLIIGGISTILGITLALMENNIKRLLAYSSVENIGIIVIGLGLSICAYANGNSVLAAFSLTAALFHTLNHSLFKGMLFLGAGAIHYSTHTKNMEKLGGLIKKMPYTSFFFLTGALAISAIPPFNGFTSKWFVYQSIFESFGISDSWLKIVLILCVALLGMAGVLAATSFIKTFGITFLALPRTNNAKFAEEVPKTMLTGMGILSFLCLLIGILPFLVLSVIDKVNAEIFTTPISGNLSGFSSFITFAGENNSSISIAGLFAAGLILIPIILILIRKLSTNTKIRVYGTWDCGYKALDSRMQYTATGFSKPMRIVLRAIYRPKRELEIESGECPYFFKTAKYVVSTQSIFEKYLYEPIIKNVINFARRTRLLIQTGSIHTYLVYIFVVIIAMFFYYAKS